MFKTKEEFKYEFSKRIIESYGRTVEESHITEKFMVLETMVRDYASVLGDGNVTKEIADIALQKLEIDNMGLDNIDRKILESIIVNYTGGPVGIETLASTIGEEVETLEDVYEPYLMQKGFIGRTPRGRVVLPKAYEHLGLQQ